MIYRRFCLRRAQDHGLDVALDHALIEKAAPALESEIPVRGSFAIRNVHRTVGGMLGGCMYPLAVVGPVVRGVGHVVPQAWAMDAFVKLIYDHAGLTAVLPEVGVLAVFAAALSALALRAYARTVYSPG